MRLTPDTRRTKRGLLAMLAALLCLGVAAGVGVTWARWSDSAARPGGILTNGNLDLVDSNAISWVETTPGVTSPASGTGLTGSSGLASFPGVPGDTVEVRYRVRTVLTGDNISATVRASLRGAAPAGVTVGGYRVLSTAAAPLAPASGYQTLGSSLTVTGLSSTTNVELLIAVRLAYTAASSYTTDVTGSTGTATTDIGLRLALEQVRTGTGFTS